MKTSTSILLTAIICLAAYLGNKYVRADPSGFCPAQQRYISDEEFIQTSLAMLAWQMPRYRAYLDKQDPKLYGHYLISYDRMERNRSRLGFASIDRSDTHTIFRWLWGYQQIQVILNANSGDEWTRVYFDVCGNVVASEINYTGFPGEITTANYLELLKKN